LLERQYLPDDGSVEPYVPGEELDQASQVRDGPAGRAWRGRHARVQTDFARAITLMDAVGRTEKDIAGTLRAMAGASGSEAAARWRRLAEEAIEGANEAAERGEQLRRLADRRDRHADEAALRQSLHHAGTVLADLASTEEDIADELTRLTGKDGSDLAEERRHLADEALAGARRARNRARALRKLAETSGQGATPVGACPGGEPPTTARRGWRRSPEDRDREAENRDEAAEARDRAAETRDHESAVRDAEAQTRDEAAVLRDQVMRGRLQAKEQRNHAARARQEAAAQTRDAAVSAGVDTAQLARMWEEVAAIRQKAADQCEAAAADRKAAVILLERVRQDRRAAVADRFTARQDREAAARDREAAARDREAAAADRQQAAIERAQERIPPA
jgi:hypothetical protein